MPNNRILVVTNLDTCRFMKKNSFARGVYNVDAVTRKSYRVVNQTKCCRTAPVVVFKEEAPSLATQGTSPPLSFLEATHFTVAVTLKTDASILFLPASLPASPPECGSVVIDIPSSVKSFFKEEMLLKSLFFCVAVIACGSFFVVDAYLRINEYAFMCCIMISCVKTIFFENRQDTLNFMQEASSSWVMPLMSSIFGTTNIVYPSVLIVFIAVDDVVHSIKIGTPIYSIRLFAKAVVCISLGYVFRKCFLIQH